MDTSKPPSVPRTDSTETTKQKFFNSRISYRLIGLWYVPAAMVLFQLLWLAAIWITGASTNYQKMGLLGIYSIVVGLVVILLPDHIFARFAVWRRLNLDTKHMLLILLLAVLLIGILYANVQRGWTWDEEHSLSAAQVIASQGFNEFFAGYAENPWLGPQHPPLVPIINGLVMRIFGLHLLVGRFVSLIFTLGTLVLTYFLGRELYDSSIGLLSAVLILSFPLIIRLGTAMITDMQVTFFFTLALFLGLLLFRQPSLWLSVLLGLAIGAGLLSKYPMVFIYPVLFFLFLTNGNIWQSMRYFIIAVLLSFVVLAIWLTYAYMTGILFAQAGLSEVEPGWYVRNTAGLGFMANSLLTKLTSAIGPYNLPILVMGAFLILRRRERSDWNIMIWVAIISLLLILTLPDHRYFMPIFPALAITMALWLKSKPEILDRAVILSLLYAVGAWWWFFDWFRVEELFVS